MTNAERQRRYRQRHRTDQEQLVNDVRYSIRIFREILKRARNVDEYDVLTQRWIGDDYYIPARTWQGWRATFHTVAGWSQKLTLTMPEQRDDDT